MPPPPTVQDATPAATSPPLHGRVLYIEDLPMSVLLVANALSGLPGIELVHAATGQEGIAAVRGPTPPDHVLLDMHLPDMTGLDVVRELSSDIARLNLPITIITSDELTMDVLKAMSLGAFEYLVKPVDAGKLESSIRRALARGRAKG